MIFSKEYIKELAIKTNFIKDNLEKVLRLSEILKFLNSDYVFKGNLALKGGTAINLTVLQLPRLSVDIDLDLAKNVSKEELPAIKETFAKRLIDYMVQEGYSLLIEPREHYALLSFVFNYINNAGNRDNIKIEINFMDRCHILPLEERTIISKQIENNFTVLVLNKTELYASKINALLSRATPRDLYDVNAMIEKNIIKDNDLLRKCLIFYNAIGGEQDIDKISFENIEKINFIKYKTQLKPLISKQDKFNFEEAKTKVINFLHELLKLNENEMKFVKEFRNKNYKPEFLFKEENIIKNIALHPMALWRCKK